MLSHDEMAAGDANLYCNVQRCICLDTDFCPQLYIVARPCGKYRLVKFNNTFTVFWVPSEKYLDLVAFWLACLLFKAAVTSESVGLRYARKHDEIACCLMCARLMF